jgi:hypothetical protein
MKAWEKQFPGRVEHIFAALQSVTPSHLLDRTQFDFAGLQADGIARPDGDIAFDVSPEFEATAQPVGSASPSAEDGTDAVPPAPSADIAQQSDQAPVRIVRRKPISA